jgi:RNA recognition motif-containing protein
MGLTKVFVGNLSFKTREADLASEFSSAGKVVSANIITRGPRSLGYGFVELESEEDAQKAVQLMNRKNIDTREINVELAKPRDESKLGERRRAPPRRRAPRGGGVGGGVGGGAPGASGGAVAGGEGGSAGGSGGRGRGGFGGRVRRYRPRNQGEGGPGGGNAPPPRRGGRGGGRGGYGVRGGNNAPRTPSKTTLFVANLPFATDDGGLSDLFKDLHITKAHVVKNRNGRSKGFGFVEFENEDDQKSALTAAEKFEVDNRKLIVKIALTDTNRNRDDSDEKKDDSHQDNHDAGDKDAQSQSPAAEKKEETKAE